MNSLVNWASARTNPLKQGSTGQGFLAKQAEDMAKEAVKTAVCEADSHEIKKHLEAALNMLPAPAIASMFQKSSFCKQAGGKRRKTRKQKRKQKQRKTRKH